VEEQARGPAERVSKAERPDLTEADLEEVIRLVRDEGQRLAAVARRFGVTRQALYQRTYRDEQFAMAIDAAEAENEMRVVRSLRAAVEEGSKTWTGWAWMLERRHSRPRKDDPDDRGWLSAETIARVDAEKEVPPDAVEPDQRFE
jgi:transposase-like protein